VMLAGGLLFFDWEKADCRKAAWFPGSFTFTIHFVIFNQLKVRSLVLVRMPSRLSAEHSSNRNSQE
jgi:hypothetical protein